MIDDAGAPTEVVETVDDEVVGEAVVGETVVGETVVAIETPSTDEDPKPTEQP